MVNVDLSMAIETYTCQYVFLMEVLTLFQLPSSSHCLNIYSPCMWWAQNPLTMLFVEITDFHSGSVDGYHITVCLCDNQRALRLHHHYHEPLILFFDKTKFTIFTVVNLQVISFWVIIFCTLVDGYNTVYNTLPGYIVYTPCSLEFGYNTM